MGAAGLTEWTNRVSEEREIPQRVLGACWNFHYIAEAAWWLESLLEVMARAASGRCRLELYRYPSCLIGEAPESRKEVSK